MLVADLSHLSSTHVYGLDQYDYGQQLELHGLSLPEAVEVHFAIDKSTAEAERRVGITKDGVTTVAIPDKMLEQSRPIVAYVYVTDAVSGKTVRRVTMPINPRQKPQDFVSPGDPLKEDPFRDAVMAVSDAAERAKASEKSAEAWAHGSVDYPEREEDNARYYAEQAGADAERAEQVYTRTEKELAVILANAANYAVESKSAKEAAEGFAEASEGYKNDAEKILNDVENVGAAKVEAIEKKGAETLKSIPEDYTALQGEVTALKQDLVGKLDKPATAQVGQIFRVKSITEDGNFVLEAIDMPIDDSVASTKKTWSSQKISDELEECVKFVKITVNLVGSEGNIPLGNTVYVYETVNEIETLSYSIICPDGTITVRVPHGIQYRITASTDVEGFYVPTEVIGVALNDLEVTIRYTELAYPKTIRDLQTLAKMGLTSNVVSIGDEFTTTYTYEGTEFEMPWVVTDIKGVEFEDGSTGEGVYLEAKYCTIESIQFDAPHQEVATEETAIEGLSYIGRTDSTYTLLTLNPGDTIPYSDYTYIYHDTIRDTSLNIYRYGHNRVSTSALRQWLNSDADNGTWWTAPKTGYCHPSQLNSVKGFMAGLPRDFLDCVAKVKRTYYTNSVADGSVIDVLYDKFFSATGTELYGSVNDNEGTYFPYYKEVTGLSAPSNGQNTGRIKYALNAKISSQFCWSFSSYRGNSYDVWNRFTTGQLNCYGANGSYRAVPACVIG